MNAQDAGFPARRRSLRASADEVQARLDQINRQRPNGVAPGEPSGSASPSWPILPDPALYG